MRAGTANGRRPGGGGGGVWEMPGLAAAVVPAGAASAFAEADGRVGVAVSRRH